MNIQTAYYVLIGFIFFISMMICIKASKIQPKLYYRLSKRNNESGDVFRDLNLNITLKQYLRVRFVFVLAILLIILAEFIIYNQYYILHIVLFLLFIIVTSPKESFFNVPLPLYVVLKYFFSRRAKLMDIELTRAISQMKNIIKSRKEQVSSDLILIEITRFTVNIRSTLNRVISFWDMGEKKKGCAYLKETIKTDKAAIIADLLSRLDELDKEQMLKEIQFYQERILNERETQIIKKRENRSFIVYALASISIMVVIINFIIIVSYFDTITMLKNIM